MAKAHEHGPERTLRAETESRPWLWLRVAQIAFMASVGIFEQNSQLILQTQPCGKVQRRDAVAGTQGGFSPMDKQMAQHARTLFRARTRPATERKMQ